MAFQITEEQKRRIEQAQQKAQNMIRQEISQFYKNIDILTTPKEKKEPTFWDRLSMLPSMGYDALKGALDSVVGAVQSINVIISNFGNDIAHMFDESDGTSWDTDLKYAVGNLGTTLVEGLVSFGASTAANLGRVMQTIGNWESDLFKSLGWDKLAQITKTGADFFDPKWAFGEDGFIEQTADLANEGRVTLLEGSKFRNQIISHGTRNISEDNQRKVDNRYYDGVESYLKGSVNVQNFIEEKITTPTADFLLGQGKDKAMEIYGEKEWYQTLSGVSESIGNILAMWAVGGLAKKALGPMATPENIKAVGTTYFFSSTFGKSYQEAINNGTGLNDAFTYATGQAMMESLLEQMGGFKPGEDPSGVFKRLQEKGITGILIDAANEGIEELASEFGGTGFGVYNGGIEEIDNREFYSKAMFSFLSGAGSSLFLGGARNAVYNRTVNTKAQAFYNTYKQDASVLGQDKALAKMNSKLGKIAEGLNGNAFGLVANENDVARLTFMNLEQKREFIEKNGLGEFIEETDSGFAVKKITADIFYNKIDTGKKDAQGNIIYENIKDEDYAINENVRGSDITYRDNDGKLHYPTKMSNLTELGKRALEVGKKMNVPIAIVSMDNNDTGGYAPNGIMYINENNIDENNVEQTIIKHEIVHAISDTDSKVYKEIEREVDKLVTMTVVDGNMNFEYANETIKNIFRKNGIESNISQSAQEYFDKNGNAVGAMKLAKEETVAYFIQNIIEDTEISRMLSKNNPSLFNKLANSFDKYENLDKFAEGDPKVTRQIKKIKKHFERGVTRVVEKKKTIGYIMENRAKAELIEKAMKEVEKAEKANKKKRDELVKSIVDFLGLFNDEALDSKEIAKLKTDKEFMAEKVLKIKALYQEAIDDDTATDAIKQAYATFEEKFNNVVNPDEKKTEKTPEGFNIIKKSKKIDPNLTDEDRQQIKKIFPTDEMMAEFFTTNKKGEYVLKNEKVTAQSKKQNTVMFQGKKYRSTEYGVNAYNEVGNENIDVSRYDKKTQAVKPLKISEMTKAEHLLHLFFSSTRLNYILYKMDDGYGGFSVPTSKANVVFINTRTLGSVVDSNGKLNLLNSEKLVEILIHEHVHEAFKYARMDAFSYAYEFADIMFEPVYNAGNQLIGVNPTQAWNEFQKHYTYNGGYLNYFNKAYQKKDGYVNIKTELELYNLLKNSKNRLSNEQQRSINETTAQITGVLFSSYSVYQKVLQGKSGNTVKMFELYDKLMNDPQMDTNVKAYLKDALKKYEKLFNTYMNEIAKIFPSSKKYTLQELNDFINTFTSGKFTTKGALLTAYFQEKANKKRGDASNAVDNIIYIASTMGAKVKSAVEVFTQLEKEFTTFRNQVESLITNPESILKIDTMTNIFKRIKKADVLVRVFNKTYKGNKTYQLDESTFVQILNEIDLLSDIYDFITDETIVMFDLPSRKDVTDALDQLEYAVNRIIDQIINDGYVSNINEFSMAIDNFKDKLKAIGNSADINSGIFGKIKKMQQALRDSNVKNILFAIERSLKNANASYQSMKRSSETSPNEEYLRLYGGFQDKNGIFHEGIFNRIYKVIKENANDFDTMKQQLTPLLEEIRTLIHGSQVVGNEFAKSDDYINGDQTLQNEILQEIQKVKDHLINEVLNEIYEQFAFLFNDTQFVRKQYPTVDRYTHLEITDIVKEFKENKIASNMASILKEFQTVFETVFSKGESLNSYAKKNTEQIQKITEQFKTKGMDGIFMRGLPPQDILSIYAKITKGKMDFFEDFFREYKRAAFMREKVIATFQRNFIAWESAHKNNIEKSTELVDIDTGYFVRMSKDNLVTIKTKAEKQVNDIRDKIEILRAEKKKLSFERKEYNKKIANEQKIKEGSTKGQKLWDDANARQRAIQSKKDAVVQKEKQLKQDIDNLKAKIRLMDEQALIKKELIRVAEENKKKGRTQQFQRGHIASTYLSIIREIEMQAMADNGDITIKPTNHFAFGNQIDYFDNQLMEQKGYKRAKKAIVGFTIFAENKQELADYLKSLLTEEDLQNIDFAKTVFDQNYEFANQMYKEKYLVDLPRQQTYIPFSTRNADKTREFELKRINRRNLGVDRGFILETTLGASQDLMMENIFSVMHNHTRTVANYSFDRLNTDFQNLLVNKSGGTSFQSLLSGEDTIFGVDNGVEQNINNMLMNIAQYNDINEAEYVKRIRKVLRATVRAVIGLALPMYITQYLSMITISSKNNVNLLRVIKHTSLSARLNNKYFKYLMQHNDNFFLRAQNKFIPNLSDYASANIFGHKSKWLNKAFKGVDDVSNALTAHVGRADARVLVGAFRAKAEEIRKQNPQLHEDAVLAQANEWLTNEVLLFGVANSSPAFRASFLNSKNVIEQMAGKFQSENSIQYGAIVRDIIILKNGHKDQYKMLTRDLAAFLLSGLFSALVGQWWGKQMGYDDDVKAEDEVLDFIFNEFLWDNLIGSMPYINQFTQMWRWNFDEEKGSIIKDGFDPKIPLFSEIENIKNDFKSIVFFNPTEQEKERNARKYYEIIEETMHMFGIPIKNARKIGQLTSNIMAEYGSKQGRELDMLFNNKTRSEAYYNAIKQGNREEINGYVSDRFENLNVQNEIVRLGMKNQTVKIYDVTYFRAMDEDGKYKEYSISQEVSDKYKGLTQRSLVKLFRSSSYRKLPDHLKAKAMQRVINYYYNYMKASILYDMKKGDKPSAMNSIDEVVERSIEYSLRELEKEK